MRISDWSSDVCSSDLQSGAMTRASFRQCRQFARGANPFYQLLRSDTINGFAIGRKIVQGRPTSDLAVTVFVTRKLALRRLPLARRKHGRASCRERVGKYV